MRLSLLMALAVCHYRANGERELVNWEDRLRATAAFQFNCPQGELTVVDLGGGNMAGISGCGRRAQYEYSHASNTWAPTGPVMGDCVEFAPTP